MPTIARLGWLNHRSSWERRYETASWSVLLETADRFGITVVRATYERPVDEDTFRRIFATLANNPVDGLLFFASSSTDLHKELTVRLANEIGLPTMFICSKEYVEIGGLMHYGPSLSDIWRALLMARLGTLPRA